MLKYPKESNLKEKGRILDHDSRFLRIMVAKSQRQKLERADHVTPSEQAAVS